jgi:diaminohydroxyphosphoribosylaminopyrimidine deaminase/5-amino-6-(5-phosphoribosylamino)uracil reductase
VTAPGLPVGPVADQGGDAALMDAAVAAAERVRGRTAPNPWVGAVVVAAPGPTPGRPRHRPGPERFVGATSPPGGPHAEVEALARAGERARGGTLVVTLEPCAHHGRTPPCTEAIVAAGVRRVVVGMVDPDPAVQGRGIETLRAAGVEVEVGTGGTQVAEQLAPYVKHRRTGRPWVVLKLAATLDGRIAAPDGSSRWITGPDARADVHRLRATSDAVLVGAGTVRADDPSLTVRLPVGDPFHRDAASQPRRVVLGRVPVGAAVAPATELSGDLGSVLDRLGADGVLQLLVEGGAGVAGDFHRQGLVDAYVVYLAPVLLGGDDGRALFAGPGAATLADAWRGTVRSVTTLGPDIRVVVTPAG